jgi:hypothetical protein
VDFRLRELSGTDGDDESSAEVALQTILSCRCCAIHLLHPVIR